MKLRGLQAQIVGAMAHTEWWSKGKLTADIVWKRSTGRRTGVRYLPETVGRALRLLEEKCILAVKQDGKSVSYKWIPYNMRQHYIPYTERPSSKKDVLFRAESGIVVKP